MGENLGIGHEVARECPYPLNDQGGTLTQLWILTRHIEREVQLESYYDRIIMDRSVFDSIPYCEYLTYKIGKMKAEDLFFARNMAFEWAKIHPYTSLIYLKPLPFEGQDSQRSPKIAYQEEIDKRLFEVLKTVPYKVITVDVAPKEERCLEVYRIVRKELYG